METSPIKTYLVNGFLEGGKTTYIQECIFNDFFHKRGSTLILSFEQGDLLYDEKRLEEFRTSVIYYDPGEYSEKVPKRSVKEWIKQKTDEYKPDRVYIEMNAFMEDLRDSIPEELKVIFSVLLIDGFTISLYFNNMRQLLQNMLTSSDTVIFRGPDRKEDLLSYENTFRIINRRAVYLWQAPMGYREKAFGVMLPFDLDRDEIWVSDESFPAMYLDSLEKPSHYYGKTIHLRGQFRKRRDLPGEPLQCGRLVMTCCIADMQFLGFECLSGDSEKLDGTWADLTSRGYFKENSFHEKSLALQIIAIEKLKAPEDAAILCGV